MKQGELYVTLGDLQKRLLGTFSKFQAKAIVLHEKDHSRKAAQFNVQSKFIYLESQLGDEPVGLARTWYSNFHEIAQDWSRRKIVQFLEETATVVNPSPSDLFYLH